MLSISIITKISSVVLVTLNLLMLSWIILIIRSFFLKKVKNRELPKISILIPVFNNEKGIAFCLDSILNIDYPEDKIEVIVVDDGSTDRTSEAVEDFTHVKLLKQEHKGKSYALNRGLKECKGEFILVLDSDTILERKALKNATCKISQNTAAISFLPKILFKNKFLTWFQNVEYHFNSLIRRGLNSLSKGGIYVWGCATLYRTEVLKKLKFPNSLTEDLDLSVSMQRLGYRIILSEDSLAYTKVPSDFLGLIRQRIRWNLGGLRVIGKNKRLLFNTKYPKLGSYLLPTNLYWYPFTLIIVPLIILQILYWLPYQLDSVLKTIWYFFTWFSLAGPIYTLYMIPSWGFSITSLLGILPAFFTTSISIFSLWLFKEKINIKTLIGTFFLFPYFFILNFCTIISIFLFLLKSKYRW